VAEGLLIFMYLLGYYLTATYSQIEHIAMQPSPKNRFTLALSMSLHHLRVVKHEELAWAS
jgi:hypothetical protein